MPILCVIPARYASTRFPAKPLVDIAGKSMIQRVYSQVKKATQINKVIVATDHQKIYDRCRWRGVRKLDKPRHQKKEHGRKFFDDR